MSADGYSSDRMKHWALTRLTRRGKTTFTLVLKGQVQSMFNERIVSETGARDEIPYVEVEVSKETLLALRDGLTNSGTLNEEE